MNARTRPTRTGRVPEVVLLCGLAGSGKTTYARRLEARGHVRLSIDEEIWQRAGRYGIDYDPSEYDALSATAEANLKRRLDELVRAHRDVVVDMNLWRRESRDRYKRLTEVAGGNWRLVYLKVEPVELRRRLARRNRRFDANAAFPITDEILDRYLTVFEEPRDEGEEPIVT